MARKFKNVAGRKPRLITGVFQTLRHHMEVIRQNFLARKSIPTKAEREQFIANSRLLFEALESALQPSSELATEQHGALTSYCGDARLSFQSLQRHIPQLTYLSFPVYSPLENPPQVIVYDRRNPEMRLDPELSELLNHFLECRREVTVVVWGDEGYSPAALTGSGKAYFSTHPADAPLDVIVAAATQLCHPVRYVQNRAGNMLESFRVFQKNLLQLSLDVAGGNEEKAARLVNITADQLRMHIPKDIEKPGKQ
jgi:hypothetical protein